MSDMVVVYSTDSWPLSWSKSIFLAGPTERQDSTDTISYWRKDALDELHRLGYDGVVFVPEPRPGEDWPDYGVQYQWEVAALDAADVIILYCNRNTKIGRFGLTTNIEFGRYLTSGRMILAVDSDDHSRYLVSAAHQFKVPVFNNDHQEGSLQRALLRAVTTLKEYRPEQFDEREGGECRVPLQVYTHPSYQSWRKSQIQAENRIDDARVVSVFPASEKPFLFVLLASVWITREQRYKTNEILIGRSDIAVVVLYWPQEPIGESEVILIREFRTPALNDCNEVFEFPGGSSKTDMSIEDLAMTEVYEEIGFAMDRRRLEKCGHRQFASTLSIHRAFILRYALSETERNEIKAGIDSGSVFGNEGDSERTRPCIMKLKHAIQHNAVDLSMVGIAAIAMQREWYVILY